MGGHRKITLALKIGTLAVGIIIIIIYIATYANWIPLLSSVANYATVAFASISLPCVIGLLVFVGGIAAWQRKVLFFKVVTAIYVVALAMGIGVVWTVVSTLEGAGAQISLLEAYSVSEPQGIISYELPYDKDEDGDVMLTVYGNGKGLLEDLGLEVKVSQTGKSSVVSKDGEEVSLEDVNKRIGELAKGDGLPIVVYIHGGGWIENDRYFRARQCKIFAEQGYVSLTLDYTLSSENRHLAVDCATEKQLTRAIALIGKYGRLLGGDTSRIYLMGDSAGGNLALDLAYKINGGVYKECDGVELPKITAVSVIYPVADPATFYNNDDLVFSEEAKKMAEYYTGTTPEENPSVYDAITPANFITADAPPTFIMVGEHDTLVPPQATYDLADALEKAGVECELVRVPGANHTMDIPTGNSVCQGYGQLAHAWFEKHQ